jgi:hypothetical protein
METSMAFNPDHVAGYHPGQSTLERYRRTGELAPTHKIESITRETHRHHVPCETLRIKSTITPETVYFNHYPGDTPDRCAAPQLHVTTIMSNGISGTSIFLTEHDAVMIRDFLNKHYPR